MSWLRWLYPGTIWKKCRLCKDSTPHVNDVCQRCGTYNG